MNSIALESVVHHQAVRNVTEAAFAGSEHGHNGEADLIDSIRAAHESIVSLVATVDDGVIGHILFSPVTIRHEGRTLEGFGLGPMAVLPAHQKAGVGSNLVVAGLETVSEQGSPFAVVAGDPKFYSRFGFVPASDFGILHGFDGMPQEFFMIRPSNPSCLADFQGGLAFYAPEFGPQHTSQ